MKTARTVDTIRLAEAGAIAAASGDALMRRAAAGVAGACLDQLGGAYGRRVHLIVGAGDNGGDALYAGVALARRGVVVTATLVADRAHPRALAVFLSAGGRLGLHGVPDLVIDGVVGIGGRPGLRPEAVAAFEAVAGVPVLAVDVPSGVEVDTGETPEPHVEADVTVTFGSLRHAHLVDPAAAASGCVVLVDLGIDFSVGNIEALEADDVRQLLPVPDGDDHKYSRGVVGVRAGSARYPGAAVLAVAGASIGLAGMVRYVGAATEPVLAAHPEVVGDGKVQAWVVGSGTDRDAESHLHAAGGVPIVIDADALARLPGAAPVDAVLTPHAGELAAMLGVSRDEIEASPLRYVREAAEAYDAVVLLKGRRTLIARPDGRVRVNTTGTPWLATAGSGDVLAGLIGSLLATGSSGFDAASVGAWLHGRAAEGCGDAPLTAAMLPAAIRAVVKDLLA